MVTLRPYQTKILSDIYQAWGDGHQNVCAVMPTGAGKTVAFGTVLAQEPGIRFAIAHRQELVSQMSMTLAKLGIDHCVLATDNLIKYIIRMQIDTFGKRFHDPRAKCFVTGVQTLINRAGRLPIDRAALWILDECHHSLRSNIWGKALSMFPDTCRGLGVTATPNRADGRGIGRHADGLFDTMVEGPNMRYLIDSGYLTDYRIFGPYTDIDLSSVAISAATGDYSKPKLVAAVRKSRIVGDVVKAYQQFAAGKIGVVFVPDVQTGEDMAVSFCAAGIPAKCVHAGTPDAERQNATGALKRGDLKILTNVDIFGEGYDLPAIECVIFARPTESYPLYVQQFGRGLRTMPGKEKAIIIDHVHNIERHGKLPDSPQTWSLDSRERKASAKDPDLIPIRTCRECLSVYESWQKDCPFCGWKYAPLPMGTIEQVEGVITELDPSVLAAMRGEVLRIDGPPPYVPGSAQQAINAQWKRRQDAQRGLREAMSVWAGYQRTAGQSDDIIMRRFYKIFGTDVITAQTFGRRDAEELTLKLMESLE